MLHLIYYSFLFAVIIFSPKPVYAYLDPGAGAGIVALLASGFTGIIILFHLVRDKVKGVFRKDKTEETEDE